MSSLLEKIKQAENNLVNLTYIKIIRKEDKILPKWLVLNDEYKTAKREKVAKEAMSIISIVNAVLNQERLIFTMTRDALGDLFKSDKNWGPNGLGFDNNRYSKIKALMINSGIFKEVKPGGPNVPSIFQLVDDKYRKFLIVDESKQLQEAHNFVSRKEQNKLIEPKATQTVSVQKVEPVVEMAKSTVPSLDNADYLETVVNDFNSLRDFDTIDFDVKSLSINDNELSLNENRKVYMYFGKRKSIPSFEDCMEFLAQNNIELKYWPAFMEGPPLFHFEQFLIQKLNQLRPMRYTSTPMDIDKPKVVVPTETTGNSDLDDMLNGLEIT